MIPSSSEPKGTAPSGTYRYPQTDFDEDADYVKIRFFDYTAPFSAEGGGTSGATIPAYNKSSSGLGKAGAILHLYMPEDIEGQYGGNWETANISEVAKSIEAFGKASVGDGGGAVGAVLNTIKTSVGNISKGTVVANVISQALSQSNFGSLSVNDIFSVTTGQILNPNTEVLYKGPKMRTFGLNFKMAPRNSKEADSIKNIIQAFKYATLPKYGGRGDKLDASFVAVPQIVDVSFMKGNKEIPWVTQYKPAVITDLSISYTPDGAWATLPNGSPVATTIRVSFQETKMIFADEVVGTGATY